MVIETFTVSTAKKKTYKNKKCPRTMDRSSKHFLFVFKINWPNEIGKLVSKFHFPNTDDAIKHRNRLGSTSGNICLLWLRLLLLLLWFYWNKCRHQRNRIDSGYITEKTVLRIANLHFFLCTLYTQFSIYSGTYEHKRHWKSIASFYEYRIWSTYNIYYTYVYFMN